ncbi:hypothetical protein F4604DRAFT_1683050 [Suillus subluteus]|nr:hypothetical protein F4604DRAFT_1683050 [Suillus subluteus]
MTHIIRSSPKVVFFAQLFGAEVSNVISASLYAVFSTIYPCINDLAYMTCAFSTPGVQAWRVVTIAVFLTTLSILLSSGFTAIMSVVAKYQRFLQDITSSYYVGSYPDNVFRATQAFFWTRKYFDSYQTCRYPVAASLIAGEGVGKCCIHDSGNFGATYGTDAGCPSGI